MANQIIFKMCLKLQWLASEKLQYEKFEAPQASAYYHQKKVNV